MKEKQENPAAKSMVFCPLEEGIIDFEAFREALLQVDFNGIAVVEQDMATATAEESSALPKKNKEFLTKIGLVE